MQSVLQPEKANQKKRQRDDDSSFDNRGKKRGVGDGGGGLTEDEREKILQMVENDEVRNV